MNVTVKISSLEGTISERNTSDLLDNPALRHAGAQQALPSDLYVVVSLWADNKPLIPPFRTAHKTFKSKSNYAWNESLSLPIKYRDLPLSAQLAITVYDIAGPREVAVVGGSTMRLFGKKATLKKGKQRLYLWKGKEADGGVESETPSKVGLKDEMGRLEKLVKKHERGDITRMDWLDKLAFRQIEKIHAVSLRVGRNGVQAKLMLWCRRLNRTSRTTCSSTSTCLASTSLSCSAKRCAAIAGIVRGAFANTCRDSGIPTRHPRLPLPLRLHPCDLRSSCSDHPHFLLLLPTRRCSSLHYCRPRNCEGELR